MAISKQQFRFKFTGAGHYLVDYVTKNGKSRYSRTITDMEIIDKTRTEEYPKQIDLIELRRQVKI
jgi:hypothetical protein